MTKPPSWKKQFDKKFGITAFDPKFTAFDEAPEIKDFISSLLTEVIDGMPNHYLEIADEPRLDILKQHLKSKYL